MKYKKPTAQDLRRVNSAEILRKIYFDGPISRLEVSQQIGISPATVTNIVYDLLEKNLLVESGSKRSEGGRPSTLLTINPGYGYFLGSEVGESFINIELFDIRFNSCQKVSFPLNEAHIDPEQVEEKISLGIQQVLAASGIKEHKVIGMGVGFPGLVDPVKGISVFTPNWGWHDVPLLKAIKRKHPFPMFLENGAKAMAMGEALFGAGRGVNNLTVLLMGTGVGCGIISDRSLFRGSVNSAGEIGHTIMNIDGPACRCGGHGCTEVYLGANGIIERYRALNADPDKPDQYDQIANIQYILDKFAQGQPAAVEIVEETLRYLGVTLANLINLLNPQLLLLGGWSGLLFGSRFLDKIKELTAYYALEQSLAHTNIRLCELAEDSVSKGAASLVLEHFFESGGELA